MRCIVFLFIFLMFIGNIYSLEYPLAVDQEEFFRDANNSFFFKYSFLSDSNGEIITSNNFQEKVDDNSFRLFIDSFDYRDVGYVYNEDVNNLRYKDIHYDYEENKIIVNSNHNFSFDIDIDFFYVYEDYFFFLSDTNLFLYEYDDVSKEFFYRNRLDTNHSLYNLEVIDINESTYVFLASNELGISVYEYFDSNYDFGFVNNVVYSFGGDDYLAKRIVAFEIEEQKYVFSVQERDLMKHAVVYVVEELLGGGGVETITGVTFFTDVVSTKKLPTQAEIIVNFDDQYCIYSYFINDGLNVDSTCQTKKRLFPTGDENLLFVVDDINNKHLSVYNTNNLQANTPLATIDTNKIIFNLNLTNKTTDENTTIYRILAINEKGLTTIDYNNLSQTFTIIDTKENFSFSLNPNQITYPTKYLSDKNTLYLGHNNLTIIDNRITTTLSYYTPYPLSNFNLSKTNITYNLYNSSSFNGDINLTFTIFNNYIKDNNTHTFDVSLNNTQTITIDENILLSTNICSQGNKESECFYVFNIKDIHNQNNLSYGDYNLTLTIDDLNIQHAKNFTLNLTRPPSGGSNKSSSTNPSAPPPSPPQEPIDEQKIIENTIVLLEKDFLQEKQLFENYFLSNFQDQISFDINFSQDLSLIKEDYNKLLEKYNTRNKINIKEYSLTKDNKEEKQVIEDNNYFITKTLTKKTYLIEITTKEDTQTYLFIKINHINKQTIDFIKKQEIIEYEGDINSFLDNMIVFNKDIKYLIDYKQISNKVYQIQEKKKEQEDKIYIEEQKKQINFSLLLLPIIFIFCFFIGYYLYKTKSQ